MAIDQNHIKEFINKHLLEHFPELQPIIEPKIKEKIKIKEKEVKMSMPVVSQDVPKVYVN